MTVGDKPVNILHTALGARLHRVLEAFLELKRQNNWMLKTGNDLEFRTSTSEHPDGWISQQCHCKKTPINP